MGRYWAVGCVSVWYRATGAAIIVVAIGLSLLYLQLAPLILVVGVVTALTWFFAGQMLLLLIHIEANTRGTYELLHKRLAAQQPVPKSPHGTWDEDRGAADSDHRPHLHSRQLNHESQSESVRRFREKSMPSRKSVGGEDEEVDPSAPRPRR
ncbi:MAG: hypothetical protein IPK52_04180 [Chloroflexi bacterium]|nr:hypothetical protein [Chloroflexota bacterium]